MKKTWIAILFIALLTICFTALSEMDHHDFFLANLPEKGITPIDDPAAVAQKMRQTPKVRPNKARFRHYEDGAQFVDLPGGGFLAIWNDVTVLDDSLDGCTIHYKSTAGVRPAQFLLEGEALREKAAAHEEGARMLIVRRTGNGGVQGLHMGFGSYDGESAIVSLTEEMTRTSYEGLDGEITVKETPKVLNYLRGYTMGEGDWGSCWDSLFKEQFPQGTKYVNGSLEIPIEVLPPFDKLGIDIKGAIVLTVDVTSADFNPFDFDVDVTWSVGLRCDEIGVNVTNPSLQVAIPLLPGPKIEIIPGLVSFDFGPKLFFQMKVAGELLYKLDVGYGGRLVIDDDFDAYYDKQQWADTELIDAMMMAEFYSGLQIGGSLCLLEGVVGIGLGYKDGYVLDIKGEEKPEYNRKHICGFDCAQGDLFRRHGPIGLGLTILQVININLWTIVDPVDEPPLYSFYNSKVFDDSGEKKCPHYGYLLDVYVRESEGDEPVQGVTVTWDDPEREMEEQYIPYASATTNADGLAEIYIPRANPSRDANDQSVYTVKIEGSKDGENSSRITFDEKGYEPDEPVQSVTLYMGKPFYTVKFYCSGEELYTERRFDTKIGDTASVTNTDKAPIFKFKPYILDADNPDNVLSAEVKEDDSTVLKVHLLEAAFVSFLPGEATQIRPMKPAVVATGTEYQTPNVLDENYFMPPEGKTFRGWQDETGKFLKLGEKILVDQNRVLTAVWRCPWESLQYALDRAAAGAHVGDFSDIYDVNGNWVAQTQIVEDADAQHPGRWIMIDLVDKITALPDDSALVIPEGVNASISFWKAILSRGLTQAREDGYVIRVEGNLELKKSPFYGLGTITGGCNTKNGGGVFVAAGGKLTMLRGTKISGNAAENGGGVCVEGTLVMEGGSIISENSADSCGGVLVMEGGSFVMNDSTISGNEAGYGGGVGTAGDFVMTGKAAITGNTATLGGGVFVKKGHACTMKVTQSAEVYGNVDWAGEDSNVFLCEDAVINADGKYNAPSIGVRVEVPPEDFERVLVFEADDESESAFLAFLNETKGEYLLNRKGRSDGVLMTKEALTFPEKPDFLLPAGILTIGERTFAGISANTVEIPKTPYDPGPPETWQTIGAQAFQGSSIQRIRIPWTVRSIDETAFEGCDDLIIFGGGPFNLGIAYAKEHGLVFVEE